ncbi:MAG: hypothetical protein JXB39_00570 [Deltaproteobacteria bacterium]|nr:hypothetical protein [Deltaproteobacteria bacterium]
MSAPHPSGPAAAARVLALAVASVAYGCAWHAGTPPHGPGLLVGEVTAPVAEPGVADALRQSLGTAIRRRGAVGPEVLKARVEEASFVPAAGGIGAVGAWTATLRVRFERIGAHPRELVLARALLVPAPDPGSSAGLPPARAAAFVALAGDLAEEAVEVLLLQEAP